MKELFKKILKKKKEKSKRTIVCFRVNRGWFVTKDTYVMKIKDSELNVLSRVCERSNLTMLVK